MRMRAGGKRNDYLAATNGRAGPLNHALTIVVISIPAMIKAFIGLLLALAAFDMTFRHGEGTSATVQFFENAAHGFSNALSDSVFSH